MVELQKENVITLPPYDEFFGHSEKISTLLVNNKLREEYIAGIIRSRNLS